jgi:hypothetical protein
MFGFQEGGGEGGGERGHKGTLRFKVTVTRDCIASLQKMPFGGDNKGGVNLLSCVGQKEDDEPVKLSPNF